MVFDVIRCKNYEMPYSGRKFSVMMLVGIYFMSLTTYLQWASPNNYAYDPENGGRALLYILAFGTAILVLQMQIGHLTRKEFSPFASFPFVILNAVLTLFAIGIHTSFRPFLMDIENSLMWVLAIYICLNSCYMFVRIVR